MIEPRTLHQYLQLRKLQRKMETYHHNEINKIPNVLDLDKESALDNLVLEIIDYIHHILGEGPLYVKFHFMMQDLIKKFKRELSQFHNVCVATKFTSDRKGLQQIKRANTKLEDYLKECQQSNKKTEQKLLHLKKMNLDIDKRMFIKKDNKAVENEHDDFLEEEEVIKPQKLNRIDFGPAPVKEEVKPKKLQVSNIFDSMMKK